MTKFPWQGKETKANHEVFVMTKPGECILVDQMTSTEVGFYAQIKGKLTKKRYKRTTVFINHFSRLRFFHLQLNDKSDETLSAKLAFEQYTAEHGVSRSSNITATMDTSMTTPSDKHAMMQGNNSPSVGSMPTFKMALPSKPSETSWKVHTSNCSTRLPADQRQSILYCGHMPCKM
jgi:hypothetical protein